MRKGALTARTRSAREIPAKLAGGHEHEEEEKPGGTTTATNRSSIASAPNSSESVIPSRRVTEEQKASPWQSQPTSFIEVVSDALLHKLDAEVLVMPCAPNIFTGANFNYFGQLGEMVGAEQLESSIAPYLGVGIGQTHLIDMPPAARDRPCSIKAFALVLYPPSFAGDSFFDLYLCYRNALDRAAEEGHTSIAFVHPFTSSMLSDWTVMRTAVCTIGHWLATSAYQGKIKSVTILCDSRTEEMHYERMVGQLAKHPHEPLELLPSLRKMVEGPSSPPPPTTPTPCASEELMDGVMIVEVRNFIASTPTAHFHNLYHAEVSKPDEEQETGEHCIYPDEADERGQHVGKLEPHDASADSMSDKEAGYEDDDMNGGANTFDWDWGSEDDDDDEDEDDNDW